MILTIPLLFNRSEDANALLYVIKYIYKDIKKFKSFIFSINQCITSQTPIINHKSCDILEYHSDYTKQLLKGINLKLFITSAVKTRVSFHQLHILQQQANKKQPLKTKLLENNLISIKKYYTKE